jgi:iron(III) transport system permease protein
VNQTGVTTIDDTTTEQPSTTTVAGPTGRAAPPPDRLPRVVRRAVGFVQKNLIGIVVGLMLLTFIAAPLAFLVRMAFSENPRPSDPGGFSVKNFRAIADSPATSTAIWNTAIAAVGVTVLSVVVASVCAWLVERTDLPFRNIAWVIMLAPLALPGMLTSMAYILLFTPRAGIINVAIRDVLGAVGIDLATGPLNIYSMWGMIFVDGMQGATTVFLMLVGAFRLMDPSLEEAAIMSGKNRLETLRSVTPPMMRPVLMGALIYAFVSNLQDFDTPLILGLPAGIFVLPTLIYFSAYSSPTPNFGIAAAYACLFIVVMVLLSVWYYRVVIRNSKRFSTVSGKGYRPARTKLGRGRKWAVLFFVLVGLATTGLPLLVLFYAALLPTYRPPSFEAFGNLTFSNFTEWITSSAARDAVQTTVVIALSAAVVTMGVSFIISWAVIRLRVRGRGLMDTMAFVPNAIPAVALGLALVMFFLNPAVSWTHIYGTSLILVIGFAIHYLAYATRVSNGAMAQMSSELEEAGWVAGIGKLRTLARVTLPVVVPTLIAGGIWVFAKSFKNLTLPLLLASPRTRTVSMTIYDTWNRGDVTGAAALGISLIVLLAILALFARRVIARGFTEA